jgi:hypothetical protein
MCFGLIACEDGGPCAHGADGGQLADVEGGRKHADKQSWTAVKVYQIWFVA